MHSADITVPSTSGVDEKVEEAGEVFIYMHRQYRVSRNIRAHWYFDHLNKEILIEDQPPDDEYGREMSVVGIIAKNGNAEDYNVGKKFLVSLDTKVTYISRFYRHVFILDLSPSSIVADDETNCCLHTKLLECLRLSMASVTRSFTIPGTHRRFSPQIYISVIVFIPFLGFEDDLVLVHGTLLTESNIEDVLTVVTAKFNKLINSLCNYSRPILQKWGQLRRRHRNRFDSACDYETDYSERENLGSYMEEARMVTARRAYDAGVDARTRTTRKRHPLRPLDFPKQIWKINDTDDGADQADAKCDGYIFPEWALIFMLRLGLIAVQTLPENTQSNVIVITDAVAGMPDSQALQDLLNQIRSYTVSCSFIQLKGRARSEACFGHVSSCELFHFLAMATFGAYIPNCKCSIGVDMNSNECLSSSSEAETEVNEDYFQQMNSFHRALICWSFQNALQDNLHITNLVNEINPTFAELYKSDTVRHFAYSSTYHTTIQEILYVRLREGFTLKTVELLPETNQIQITLSMPFRPLVFIQYIIQAGWPVNKRIRGPIHIQLVIEAPYNEIKDLLTHSGSNAASSNIARLKLLKSLNTTIEGIMSADRLLLHIHSFNMCEAYYNVPEGIRDLAIFHTGENRTGQPMVREVKMRGYRVQDDFGKFLSFWRVLCGMNDGIWQKWVHMHFDRVILRSEKVPTNIFSDPNVKIECGYSKDVLHKLLKERSSFCLIREKLYVTFVRRDNEQVPSYFYMVRVSHEPPCIVMKTAFLGGLNSTERRNVMEEFRAQLLTLRIDIPESSKYRMKSFSLSRRKKAVSQEAMWLIRRPLERILVRYEQIPTDLRTIVRISSDETGDEKNLTMHNAVSKYLQCRRKIWRLNGSQLCHGAALRKLVDFILNVLLRKRLIEKFKVAWTTHGIVGCCRQMIVRELGASLEQSVLFPPTAAVFSPSDNYSPSNEEMLIRPITTTLSPGDTSPLLVISELWREPGADLDDIDGENSLNPILKTDNKLVAVLYTVDSLIRVCDSENHPPLHNFNVEGIKNVRQISGCVQLINNSFNIDAVLQNSNRALLHFPTFEPEDGVYRLDRLSIVISTLHFELEEIYDNFFTINDEAFFGRAMEDVFYQTRGTVSNDPCSRLHEFASKCRIYLRRINPWSVSVAIVPIGKELPNYYKNCLPVIVSVFDEAQLAFIMTSSNRECIAQIREVDISEGADPTCMAGWVEPAVYEVPEELISASRCVPEVRRSYSPVLLSTIIKEFSDLIVERTVVKALYIALRNDVSLGSTNVDEILTDQCQFAALEVAAVPGALENFCLHMQEGNPDSSVQCCEVAQMEFLFKSTLARSGFKVVPNMPSYYFYNPQTEDSLHSIFDGSSPYTFRPIQDPDLDNPDSPCGSFPLSAELGRLELISENCYKKAENPLFVYFHCDVIFSDRTEESFPIHFLPSCVEHVLELCKNKPESYDVRGTRVELRMYVMTCSPGRNKSQPRSLLDWDDDDEDIPHSKRNEQFLSKLPNKDRIMELLKNMNRLLELESVLMDSRKDFVTLDRLEKVAAFINKECQKGGESGHVEQRSKQVTMVLPGEKHKEEIMRRLDGMKIGYCVLRRTENSNMFYSCKVEDEEEFRRSLKKTHNDDERRDSESRNSDDFSPRGGPPERKQSILRPPAFLPVELLQSPDYDSVIYENGVPVDLKRPDVSCDFWVVITLDEKINGQFCQRYRAKHHQMFDLIWEKCRSTIKCVNQEILLDRMMETKICDELLATAPNYDPAVRKQSREIPRSAKGQDEITNCCKDTLISNEVRCLYPHGYFTCALQEKIWFHIHERLQNEGTQYSKAVVGWHVLSQALKDYVVTNIPNTYVVKESNGNIVYIQLYTNKGSFEAFIKHNKISMRRGNKRRLNNYATEKFKDHVLMSCYSVYPPGKEITEDLALMLKTKLDNKVLDAIVLRAARLNHLFCLIPADIPFIQPEGAIPLKICYSSVPRDMSGYLSAVIYYAHQHLCTFMNLAQFSTDQEDKKPTFKPYFTDDKIDPLSYPTFYVFPSRNPLGIACVQTRLLAPDGTLAQVTHGVLRTVTHNQFVKYIPDKRARFTAYREMTHTELYDEINPKKEGVCAYVEFVIWVIGSVKLPELESALLSCVELAHCDVVTEYGILNTTVFDNFTIPAAHVVPLSPGPGILQPSSASHSRSSILKASPTAAVRRDGLKKRDSSDQLVVSQPALPSSSNAPSPQPRVPQSANAPLTPLPQNSSSDGNIKKNSGVFSFENNYSGGRRGSVASDIGTSGGNELSVQTTGLCVNPKFLATYSVWFEYVSQRPISGEFDSLNTVIKFQTQFESPFTARSALTEMGIRIEDTIKENKSAVQDKVYYCVHNDKPEYGGRFVVVPISAGKLEIDRAYCPEETCASDVMMVMMSTELAEETIRYGYEWTRSDPPAIFDEFVNNNSQPNVTATEKQWENENRHLYFPNFKTGFIPRQRILVATLFSDVLTVYFYNFHPLVAREIRTILVRAANWHAARSNLVRQVGLHKMGISHLTPIRDEPVEKDERYEHLIWRMTEQLIDYTYPPYELHLPRPERVEIINMLHRPFRFFDYEYVPYIAGPDPNRCSLQATWRQIRLLRDQLVNKIDRSRMYKRMIKALMRGAGGISEEQLVVLLMVSRRIHFVQTPVLLFPKWRRKIAEVRGTVSPSSAIPGVTSPLAKQNLHVTDDNNISPASNTTPPRLSWTSQLRPRTNTLTKPTAGHESPQNGNNVPVEGAEPELRRLTPFHLEEEEDIEPEKENGATPLRFKSSDEDPVQVKILYMLMKDYVDYLTKLGMGRFSVINMEKNSLAHNMYTIEYKQGCRHPPVITMYKACRGGIVIAHLSFNQPYFIINIGVVVLPELISMDSDSTMSDNQKRELVMELEKMKDEIVAHCHLHSFTYDFHLRMLSKYLVGKDEVLFDPGYNTSSFLLDFLKYYGCRPPNARNCVYEERPTFKLDFDIQGNKVWDHFLAQQYVRKYGWKVVKIKNTEDDKETSGERLQPHDYMLVSSESPNNLETIEPPHEKLRVLLRDRRRREKRSTLNVVQYLILVDPIQCGPLDEESHRDGSRNSSSQGTFENVVRMTEEEREAEKEAEKNALINSMMEIVNVGQLPSLDNLDTKRQPQPQRETAPHVEEEVPGPSNGPTDPKYLLANDLEAMLDGVDSDTSSSENLVAVQGSASRRHRKEVLSDDGEIPGENVTYVQYVSHKQKNLQDILERAAGEYSAKLSNAVKEAERECRRNDLWKLVLTPCRNRMMNRPTLPKNMQSNASWQVLRNVQSEPTSRWFELDDLLKYVNVIDMTEREPRLSQILLGTNCARLCRFLFARYTPDRCRFFEDTRTTRKRLIITHPDDAGNCMFLVSCEGETTPKLSMLLKEIDILNMTQNAESVKFKQARLDVAFDELIQCVTASLWCDLLQKPPGKGKDN